jgi:hypothetical protein
MLLELPATDVAKVLIITALAGIKVLWGIECAGEETVDAYEAERAGAENVSWGFGRTCMSCIAIR